MRTHKLPNASQAMRFVHDRLKAPFGESVSVRPATYHAAERGFGFTAGHGRVRTVWISDPAERRIPGSLTPAKRPRTQQRLVDACRDRLADTNHEHLACSWPQPRAGTDRRYWLAC